MTTRDDHTIIGSVQPPSPHFTGRCPCGCDSRWENGEQLYGLDHAIAELHDLRGRLDRIKAAALSDPALQAPGTQALRDFLLREADPDA